MARALGLSRRAGLVAPLQTPSQQAGPGANRQPFGSLRIARTRSEINREDQADPISPPISRPHFPPPISHQARFLPFPLFQPDPFSPAFSMIIGALRFSSSDRRRAQSGRSVIKSGR